MKKKTYFYKIYFSVIAFFIVILCAGLFVLNDLLLHYEMAQPHFTVMSVVDEYIKKGDIYSMKEKFGLEISEYESKESVDNYIKSITEGKEYTASTTSLMPEGCDEAFCVKAGDERLMNLYLKKSDEKGKYGLSGYKVVASEFTKNIYKTKYITMYSDSNVIIGIEPINENSKENLPLPAVDAKYLESNPIYPQKVTLDKLVSGNVDVSVIKNDGRIVSITEDNGTFVVPQEVENYSEISEFATKAVENYAAYMQNDVAFGTVARYFLPGTDFYKNLSTSLVLFAWDHDGYVFEDVKTSDIHKYSDDLYSCRVTFTQKLLLGNREYKDNVDKIAYITYKNGAYKVVDLQSVGAENE